MPVLGARGEGELPAVPHHVRREVPEGVTATAYAVCSTRWSGASIGQNASRASTPPGSGSDTRALTGGCRDAVVIGSPHDRPSTLRSVGVPGGVLKVTSSAGPIARDRP